MLSILEDWLSEDLGVQKVKLLQNAQKSEGISGIDRVIDDAVIFVEEFLDWS
jgi:hypothetical protein